MSLDASAQAVLDLLAQFDAPPMEQMTVPQARATLAGLTLLAGEAAPVASVQDRTVGGVPSKVITPNGDGPFPVLVWIHGGGWVLGSATESMVTTCNLAAKAGCVVVSLDYRLAPEHKAPAATEDCYAAVRYALDHAAELGGNGKVAVGGDSAGGNLSALCALRFGPELAGQVLIYPGTDFTGSFPSIEENADGYLLTKAAMEWFGEHYLGGTGLEPTDPLLSPHFAGDDALAATPRALVVTAGYDPLRDEGEAYAARLDANGVEVTAKRFAGQIHGFYSMPGTVPEAVEAENLTADFLRAAWA